MLKAAERAMYSWGLFLVLTPIGVGLSENLNVLLKDAQRYIGARCNKKGVVDALLLDQLAKCFQASTEKKHFLISFPAFRRKAHKSWQS